DRRRIRLERPILGLGRGPQPECGWFRRCRAVRGDMGCRPGGLAFRAHRGEVDPASRARRLIRVDKSAWDYIRPRSPPRQTWVSTTPKISIALPQLGCASWCAV